jgi:hypothetical protein
MNPLHFSIIIALFLLTLVAGTFLLAWISKQDICCKKLVKIIALFVIVISLFGVLSTMYQSYKFCQSGGYAAGATCPLVKKKQACAKCGESHCSSIDCTKFCVKKDCDRKTCTKQHKDDK